MAPVPYRTPASHPPDAMNERADEAIRLGGLRSVHLAVSFRRSLAFMLLFVGVAAVGLFSNGWASLQLWWILIPITVMALAIFGWPALRRRGLSIELHAGGVVVRRRDGRDAIIFEEVDEVWYDLRPVRSPLGTVAHITALGLVDHDGVKHRVPLQVEGSVEVARWVLRQCSEPLLPEARRAMTAGEALTFARVRLDRDGITVGSASARWSEMRLVRMQPGRVALFRRWPVVPWRVVNLDEVPHPSVFARLVAEHAPRVEADDPLAASSQ